MKARTSIIVLFTLIFVTCAVGSIADDYEWPRWHGPNGDGISMETDWDPEALEGGPKILWKVDVGVGYSNVAIEDHRLFTMGTIGIETMIYCLNAKTGDEIWRYKFQSSGAQATPVVDGSLLYGLSVDGTLLCLKTKNGKVVWERHLKEDFNAWQSMTGWATSPVVEGNLLLLNANTVQIALNKKTGDFVWGIDDEVPSGSWGSYAATVVSDYDGTRVALFLGPSTLNAVEVTTGNKLWSYMHDDIWHPIADPIVVGSNVFISLPEYCVMLETTDTGSKELWSTTEFNSWTSTAITLDGYLYGMHHPYEFIGITNWEGMFRKDWPLRCIDAKTGTVVWEKEMKPFSLTGANGKLILLELNGNLHIAEATPSSYRELSSADVLGGEKRPRTFATPPVLYKGIIYCRNLADDLVCIDVSK